MDDADPIVPAHLRPVLGEAAELALELATDSFWPDDPADRVALREKIMQAARVVDKLEADSCTREQIARLARVAAGDQDRCRWPRTLEEADELIVRAALTRDLIMLRDALGGRPTQEELDAPDYLPRINDRG